VFDQRLIAELRARRYRPAAWGAYVLGHWHRVRTVVEERPAAVRSVVSTVATLTVGQFALAVWITLDIDPVLGSRVFLWSAVWLSLHCGWVLMHLGLLADRNGRPLRTLGAANTVTLLRSALIPALLVLLEAGELGVAGLLFIVGAASDVADGAIARRTDTVSRLGTVTDPLVDIAWNTSVIYGVTAAGLVPWWMLWLVAARYGLLLAGSMILYLVHTTVRIRPTLFGKLSGVAVTAAVALVLVNRLLVPEALAARLSGLLVATLAFLLGATIVYVVILGVLNARLGPQAGGAAAPVGRVVGDVGKHRAMGGRRDA